MTRDHERAESGEEQEPMRAADPSDVVGRQDLRDTGGGSQLDFAEPDSCSFDVRLVYPDGQTTNFSGIGLTAEQLADGLSDIVTEIRK